MDNNKLDQNELFKSSQLMILNLFSILAVILIGESLLLHWETWALVLIAAGLIISWALHIRQSINDNARLWIYSFLMMATFFFYGAHQTSTFDLALVMVAVMSVYTMTGQRTLILLCQITFYITFAYEIIIMYLNGEQFDSLVITRSLLHIALVTAVGWVARTIIEKWSKVLSKSSDEISALRDATTRLNDFLANISHEIRTPVNAVIGLTGVCIGKEKDAEVKKDLLAIEEAGKRVGEQISDILDYSEIDMNKLAVSTEDYMMSSLLNDLVTELTPYKRNNIELVIDVDANLPSVLNTDVSKLKKIMWHLVVNGLKYTKEGGVYVHITSVPREYGVNLCVEVTDTGIGMSEAEIERIFDRFYQADSGRSRATSGLGLGLTIVNGFVRSMGGFLTIESQSGKGTTVRISIPQGVADESHCMSVESPDKLVLGAYLHFEKFDNPHVRDFYNAMVKDIVQGLRVTMHRVDNIDGLKKLASGVKFTHLFVGKEEYESDVEFMENLAEDTVVAIVADDAFELPEGSKSRIMRKPFFCFPVIAVLNSNPHEQAREEEKLYCKGVRALVVDDEPMNLTVAIGIFRQYGMKVETAPSGTDAIELCRENKYDIIFMDHMMPGMDGVEAMKRIRSEWSRDKSRINDVPIVALTANTVSTAKEMFIREGFDGFIGKPVEIAELERVLRKVLPKSAFVSADDIIPADEPIQDKAAATETINISEDNNDNGANCLNELKTLGVDTSVGLGYSQNDVEFYKTLLMQYGSEGSDKRIKAEEFRDKQAYDDYAIVVHSVKSTSKMIGAKDLSEKARQLEMAAKEGRIDVIDELHDETMEEYKVLSEGILSILGAPVSGEDNKDEVMEFGPGDGMLEFAPKGGEA
ncbi:MAG: response regulator [Lachnospiraceae bacterium]|nr:response regulator [Lachnospiraceae bacterium]